MIDLRSDTVTKPSPGMLQAMVDADLGDDQKGEDPTVNALEARVARLLGLESAVFVPSATMANQIALRTLGSPGDEILADRYSHVFVYELGGPAVHSGLMPRPIESSDGTFSPEQLTASVTAASWDRSTSTVLAIENTHAESGGRPWDPSELAQVVVRARELGLRVHLDGARLFNAAIASKVDPASIAGQFDTVTVCFTKGLGCPVGAVLVGSREVVERARRQKLLFGGGMRQPGNLAGGAIYALDHNIDRLAEDHANAQLLARLIGDGLGGCDVHAGTNMVLIGLGELAIDVPAALARLLEAGVRLSHLSRPRLLRAVTHLDVNEVNVREAASRIVHALEPFSPAVAGKVGREA